MSVLKKLFLLMIGFAMQQTLVAQDPSKFQEQFQVHISKASSAINIDGILDEAAWEKAGEATDFNLKRPIDIGKPRKQTIVKITYDERFIYFGIKALDTNYYVIQTLKRDNGFLESDAVSIALDPVNQRTNGFVFSVNPYNVQTEDQVTANSGFEEMNFSWDNKWFSATSRHDSYWIAEIAIPFSTLRFKEGKKIWGINLSRSDLKNNQFSTWTDMPINFPFYDFGYSGAMIWDQSPSNAHTPVSFIPYTTSTVGSNKEDPSAVHNKLNAGFDAKVGLTSSLNLDVTVNPDFSQVDVDKQVTNLTRFNIFFPERRTFFLENADLFSNYGIPPIRPFYSRTIGLDNNGNKIPILAGARISGNITKKTRIGLMNMQTQAKGATAGQSYTAISINQQVQKRSALKAYYFDRTARMDSNHKNFSSLDKYGRNAGIDYNYSDMSGKWNGWSSYHASFKDQINTPEFYTAFGGGYIDRKFTTIVDFSNITDNYYADMGFINRIDNYDALLDSVFRKGYKQLFGELKYVVFLKKGPFNQVSFTLDNIAIYNRNNTINELTNDLTVMFNAKNTSTLALKVNNIENHLLYNTSFTDKTPIPPGVYKNIAGGFLYSSDVRKKIFYSTGFGYGEFFNGTVLRAEFGINYRAQPFGNFGFNIQESKLQFPAQYGKSTLFLIAPKIEVNFSNNLFWTTFLQYNNQRNNFNINSRIQWRYKPMSDIFLVYTDNYYTDPFLKNKNRAIVFKMNYWLNL